MTHVVTENCILCKHTQCVDVCPVDCFKETPLMLVIDPNECIDCAVCIPECPSNAIFSEEDVPGDQINLISLNRDLSIHAASIIKSKSSLPSASSWIGVPGKTIFLAEENTESKYKDVEKRVKKYRNLAAATSLSPGEWASALTDKDPALRLVSASRADFELSKHRLSAGLQDDNDNIRRLYVSKGRALLTKLQIDKLLKDSSKYVRLELVATCSENFNTKQFNVALNDDEIEVRLATLQAAKFVPTKKQLIQILESATILELQVILRKLTEELKQVALKHPSDVVRKAAYGYYGYRLSQGELNDGLNDEDVAIKLAVIQRLDFKPTVQQFESIVSLGDRDLIESISRKADELCLIKILHTENEDICETVIRSAPITSNAIAERFLNDRRSKIVIAMLERLGRKLTQKQLGICIRSDDINVRLKVITNYGIQRLTKKQVQDCLQDSNEKIRELIVGNPLLEFTQDQIEEILVDKSIQVRLKLVLRDDFSPTLKQYKQGLEDESTRVSRIYSERFMVKNKKIIDTSKQVNKSLNHELKLKLDEIAKITTWTLQKHQLKAELIQLLEKLKYKQFNVDARSARLNQFGDHAIIEVPDKQRGHLYAMRGKVIHLIRLGQGRYSTIHFAAKTT